MQLAMRSEHGVYYLWCFQSRVTVSSCLGGSLQGDLTVPTVMYQNVTRNHVAIHKVCETDLNTLGFPDTFNQRVSACEIILKI
ncbi:hypothetical protein NDU88_006517 [Pleurodeles waltl]|uniref:Uncharacterized protein n=1 Tax=Pleurodeles waltl TaxID=8319 RepID=A0AAV7TX27_PLEWA|nr:hypothetical protein NDU88_006517 [Pleurodeles waltl]